MLPEFVHPMWLALLASLPLLALLRHWAVGSAEGRFKRGAGTALRCLAVAALVVALAGPLKDSPSNHTSVVFALDVSRSVDHETAARALDFVNQAFATKDPAARMGLVVFGADAGVEVLLRRTVEPVQEITTDIQRGGTDIGRALEVAMGTFSSPGGRRVVLLSDGRENLGEPGSAVSAALAAQAIGIEIFTVPLEPTAARDEVYLQSMSAPSWVSVHEPYEVQAIVHSTHPARAHLVVMRNGALLHETDLNLKPGANVFPFVERVTQAGLYEYEAIVNSDQDDVQENNRYQTFVRVRGAPRVLHVTDGIGWGRYVTEALRAHGLTVDEAPAASLPATMHQLADYELVILNNVSGFDLSLAKMELLEGYVRDAGGGLIKLGGDKSYGAGGYFGTPIERLLPVTMDVRTEVKIPSLAVLVVIDKSGSMASSSRGERKLAIAKSAAFAAIEVLNPLDRVAVLAFDSEYEWTVGLTEAINRGRIAEELATLAPGGGTDLFRALQEGHRVMAAHRAKVKHVIVLSDGLTETGVDYDSLCRRIADDGITVSTVALGRDADRALMRKIATCANGRFYYTDNPENIPHIFTAETIVVSRGLVVEEEVRPTLAYPGEMIDGFEAGSFPRLGGYQLTFAKPSAQVLLRASEDDPLLVSWRYGLGKSVAFTSDLSGRWGQDWVAWPEFGRLLSQMARWAMRRGVPSACSPPFDGRGGAVRSRSMPLTAMTGL